MTKLLMTLTISVVASIMIIGGLIASPDAYSDNKHHDVPDECQCEKPDTLKFIFTAPTPLPDGDVIFQAEIFKKLDEKNNEEKQLGDEIILTPNDPFSPSMVQAADWGKDKLESNTAFVIYKVETVGDEITKDIVAEMEIHTSCSKPLFIGKTIFDVDDPNNGYSLEVTDGLKDDNRSIPGFEPNSCEDEKKKSTGSITVKKALTNDNGGEAEFGDFEITVTNVETTEKFSVLIDDFGMGVKDVPAGTYTLNEKELEGYTTVMIAGDTGCPSMLEEVFTIKKNKNLSCTIYNDDDGSSDGPGGIIFTNESLQIKSGDSTMHNSCDNPNIEYFDEDGIQILPCIQIISEQSEIAIVDPELKNNLRTIVLFSVFESVLDANGAAKDPQCILESILPHNDLDNIPMGSKATSNLAVKLACSDINTETLINVNYVMIDPTNMP